MAPLLLCWTLAQASLEPPAAGPKIGLRGGVTLLQGTDNPLSPLELRANSIVVWPQMPQSTAPFTGTLRLTAPDGTVTEYQAEFTPTPPPTPEPPPRFRLGVVLGSTEPTGDPPGLAVREALEDSPAAKAGMAGGDRLISAGGEPLNSFQELRDRIAASAERDEPLRVKVVRPGGEGEGARILELQIQPEELDLDATPWKPIPIETGTLDTGEPFQSIGPAILRPAESPANRRKRAEIRIEAARAQLTLSEQMLERTKRLAERNVVTDLEVLKAETEFAEARAAFQNAELDLTTAEEAPRAAKSSNELDSLRKEVEELRALVKQLREND